MFAFGKGRAQERIAVGSENDIPGLEVEGNHLDVAGVDGETIDHTISDVLLLHRLNHTGNDNRSGDVVAAEFFLSDALRQEASNLVSTHGSEFGLIRFRIVVEDFANNTLTIANHPYLALQSAEDNDRSGEAVFGMFCQTWKHRLLIVFADVSRDALHKLRAGNVFRHLADITTDQQHRIASIAIEQTVAILRLAGRTVDNGYEVICDDDSVLAFLRGVLRDEALLDDLHVACLYTRRNTPVERVSPFVIWR